MFSNGDYLLNMISKSKNCTISSDKSSSSNEAFYILLFSNGSNQQLKQNFWRDCITGKVSRKSNTHTGTKHSEASTVRHCRSWESFEVKQRNHFACDVTEC